MPGDEIINEGLAGGLGYARPTGDALAREHLRGRLGEALFGEPQEPVRLGRFVLLERLGQGGMGVVYSAYDPELDRRVALKLLHSRSDRDTGRARRRLVREARTLARLSHPNVVPVHDVGVLGEQVFLVMEFVVGQTLGSWLAREARPWRDVLAVYLQAGRGLAAAHGLGIVHRDFKPDNALIGEDGRVRVVDFGLARAGLHAQPPQRADGDAVDLTLGGVAGTPAYMAPEQFAGVEVGPAADQFSFCVALYQGFYGQRPFAGQTWPELEASVRAGTVREPPRDRRVPGRVHAALSRGLAPRAADRHQSMSALLAELDRDPARTHRRWLVTLAFAGLAGVSAFALGRDRERPAEVCQGARAELARVWSPERRARVESAFTATGRPYAAAAAPRALRGLDGYGQAWSRMHHEACVTHRRGEQSDLMLDLRMSCLERRLQAVDSSITVLEEIDPRSLGHAIQVVENLPSIASCADTQALQAEVPPPEDAHLAGRTEELRARLSRVEALEDAGRHADALAITAIVLQEAEALDYGPILAESLLARGRVAMMMSDEFQGAVEPLRRAAELGLANRMWASAVEALARRFYVQGALSEEPAEIQALIPVAEALSNHVADRGFARPLLLNNIGTVYMARGDRERARGYFERALDEMERASEAPLELTSIRKNLAMLTPDATRRASLMQQELERLEQTLGANHPWALELRLAFAHYMPDPELGRAVLAPACEMYERFHEHEVGPWMQCLYYLGFLSAELGELARAAELMKDAASVGSRAAGAELAIWRELAAGYALLYRGEHRAAIRVLGAVVESQPADPEAWWNRQNVAHARLGMGLAEGALGRPGAAASHLEAALAIFVDIGAINEDVENDQRLALARLALGRELGESDPAAGSRAATLLADAKRWYAATGGGYAPRLRERASRRAGELSR